MKVLISLGALFALMGASRTTIALNDLAPKSCCAMACCAQCSGTSCCSNCKGCCPSRCCAKCP